MKALMGIDLGTSGVKTAVIDRNGRIVGLAQRDYAIDTPQPGYAEQDPEAWWSAACAAAAEALRRSGLAGRDIAGIGLSGQMHGLVAVGADGRALRPAILWCDQRTAGEKERLERLVPRERLGELARNAPAAGFLLLSLMWLMEHEPGTYQQIGTVLLPKDYVRYRLIGELGTDTTDASATLAYDVARNEWSRELLERAGLDAALFPRLGRPWETAGRVTAAAAARLGGVPAGVPVVYGGADQPMQALGNGILRPGTASCTLGTGGQLFVPVDSPVYDPELRTHTFTHAAPGRWYMMAAILNAGLAHKWLVGQVLRQSDYALADRKAEGVPAGAEGLLFLPYLTGERTPHMDPYAQGMFFGLTLRHTDAHLIRAVLEGVAFALRDGWEIFRSLGVRTERVVASGGGAKSALWRQIIADVLGCDIYPSAMKEQACVGAALTAGIGCGFYADVEEACSAAVRSGVSPVTPIRGNVSVYEERYARFRELYASNRALFRQGR